MNSFNIGDQVEVAGKQDVFVVQSCFEQLETFGMDQMYVDWYALKEVETGYYMAAPYHKLSPAKCKKAKIDELLDAYNDCMLLAAMFVDDEYRQHAQRIIEGVKKNSRP